MANTYEGGENTVHVGLYAMNQMDGTMGHVITVIIILQRGSSAMGKILKLVVKNTASGYQKIQNG
jgi:hypothetical protein